MSFPCDIMVKVYGSFSSVQILPNKKESMLC